MCVCVRVCVCDRVCVCVWSCVCVCVWVYMYIHKYVFMTETWGWQAKHAQQFSEVLQSALVWLACFSSVRGCMLRCVAVRCSMLQCIAVCCSVLQSFRGCPRLTCLLYLSIGRHVVVCHSTLQYFALCYSLFVAALVWLACVRAVQGCSVMRCFAVCRGVLQYVAVCCSVLQSFRACQQPLLDLFALVLYRAAVCCGVWQCVTVCCSMLHCVLVCCGVLQSFRGCRLLSLDFAYFSSQLRHLCMYLDSNALQHATAHCTTLHHTAPYWVTLQHTSTQSNTRMCVYTLEAFLFRRPTAWPISHCTNLCACADAWDTVFCGVGKSAERKREKMRERKESGSDQGEVLVVDIENWGRGRRKGEREGGGW